MENEKIIFDAAVANIKIPLRVEKEKETVHRQANELLNKRYAMYEEQHKNSPVEYILAMTAYALSVQVIDLQNYLEAIINNKN